MQDYIKSKRKQIDAVIIAVKSKVVGSREVSLVITNLQESQMFLGLALGVLGAAHPYPKSTDSTDKTIEKRADQADFVLEFPSVVEGDVTHEPDQIGRIKFLRGYLQDLIDEIKSTTEKDESVQSIFNFFVNRNESLTNLVKAKLWLGQQLNNIRLNDEQYEKDLLKFEQYKFEAAEEAYGRYGAVTDFKNFQGNPMPKFSELPDTIQSAWKAAMQIVVRPPRNRNDARDSVSCAPGNY